MAKELGIGAASLIHNIPNPRERWKAPVADWVRELYRKKFGNRRPATPATTGSKAVTLPSDRVAHHAPEVETDPDFTRPAGLEQLEADAIRQRDRWFKVLDPEARMREHDKFMEELGPPPDETDYSAYAEWHARIDERENALPTETEIVEQNARLQVHYHGYRLAAVAVTRELQTLPAVQRVALIGSTANPLWKEVPRFRQYRQYRIAVWHECKDVDLAVWISSVEDLKLLQKARLRALQSDSGAKLSGVATHTIEMFLLEPETNRYLGRLCKFKACPADKRECLVPDCGTHLFLQQHERFRFRPQAISPDRSLLLFDRHQSRDSNPPSAEAARSGEDPG